MKTQRLTLPLFGLACGGGGALTIERTLAHVDGVVRAYVNPATEMAYVEYDPERASPPLFTAAIERLGFKVGEPGRR